MSLLEEYNKQNGRRDWERYLARLPLAPDQTVYDLGCAAGFVTRLFAKRVKGADGFDMNGTLLDAALTSKPENCTFRAGNIAAIDASQLCACDGLWTSFTLAYMKEPEAFVSNWLRCLKNGGWLAVTDIDGLFSCHLEKGSAFYERIESFERASEQSGIYDFRIGRKIKDIMERCGLRLISEENDWYDRELNFKGGAAPDILQSWSSRLDRMVALKHDLGSDYPMFCSTFLDALSQEHHASHGGVRFCVGIKNG